MLKLLKTVSILSYTYQLALELLNEQLEREIQLTITMAFV